MRAKIFEKAAHHIAMGEDNCTCWAIGHALGYKGMGEDYASPTNLNDVKDEEYLIWEEMHKVKDQDDMTFVYWFGDTQIQANQELRHKFLLEMALNLREQGYDNSKSD